MNLETAIKHALNGDAMLFAGAGFSTGALNQEGKEFKRGSELCGMICDRLDMEFYDDLGYVSDRFIRTKSSDDLIGLLHKEYICKSVSSDHEQIMKIDWKRVYTTNYDNVIEKASSNLGKYRIPITLSKKVSSCVNKRNTVIHLNGYIEDLTREKLYSEFKLSKSSYINDDFTNSDWITLFQQDLNNAKAIFFIGYSLKYDLDIQRLLVQTENLREKCFFITHSDANEIDIDIMSGFGQVHNNGINGFSKLIGEIEQDFEPMNQKEDDFNCFDHIKLSNHDIEELSDKDIFDLFIKGNIKLNHLINRVGKEKYFVDRTKIDKIIEDLNQNITLAIIHSDLGNGKTGIINNLISMLLHNGEIYVLNNKGSEFSEEIEKIAMKEGIKYIIVEDYNLYLKEIKLLKLYKSHNIKFIFTARSYINDIFYLQLINSIELDENEIGIYEINYLDDNEINKLIKIFDEYHLWGRNSNYNYSKKKNLLKRKYKSKFQNILIGLMESEAIDEKLDDILEVMQSDQNIEDIILLSFINSIVGLHLKLEDIIYLLDKIYISAKISRDVRLKELIDIKQNEIMVRSSVLALHIIKSKNLDKEVIKLLIKVMEAADRKECNNKYFNMKRLLISFSNLRLIFKDSRLGIADNVIKYYEGVKNLNFNKKNPFFWLQYAIATLEIKDFKQVKTYLNNAYAYAEEIDGFDAYQIDSHYARYLLENELYNNKNNAKKAYESFLEAHSLIYNNNNKPAHLHYPLRQASHYLEYYRKFYNSFDASQQAIFFFNCNQIMKKIEEYNNAINEMKRDKNYEVTITENNIREILKQIKATIKYEEYKKENLS